MDSAVVCRRTLKYMMGILRGVWVVGDGWVAACAAAGRPMPEDTHEVAGDINGNQGGPILGRLQRHAQLLHGYEVLRAYSHCLTLSPFCSFNNSPGLCRMAMLPAHPLGNCAPDRCCELR